MLRWTITISYTARFFNDWFRDWGKIINVTSNLNFYICLTYWECKQFHMDLLYSQGNMCNIPCDLWVSSQHIVHTGRDRHTFHCHISGLLGSQDLSNTHRACSDHMDCQCGWACRCKWICGPSHYTKHFDRTVRRGKDPGTLDQNTPLSEGIHHLIYIQL